VAVFDHGPRSTDSPGESVQTLAHAYAQQSQHSQRNELILAHLHLVRHVIGRLRAKCPRGVDLENLEAAGVLGLVEAANRFEPERGTRFETFAYIRIRGAVLDELRRNCPLPQHLLERIAKVRAASKRLLPPVTVEQLAEATGLGADDVTECLSALRLTRAVSWDDIVGTTLARAADDEQPEHRLEQAERRKLLADAIAQLPERERLVVTLYYLEELRLKEIGVVLDLSESRISRLLKTAVFNLGEFMRTRLSA
jgi:RNA polymerase sigma factor for flagellar operon FliA